MQRRTVFVGATLAILILAGAILAIGLRMGW